MAELICVVCGTLFESTNRVTCGKEECHERFVKLLEFKHGMFKKITRMTTDESFKVPLRDIIENGIREEELDKYPKWED